MTEHQLFKDFEMTCGSVWIKILYNTPTEFSITVKLVRLIKRCLNENCNEVRLGKYLSDAFLFRLSKRKGCIVTIALQLCCRIYHQGGSRK